MLTLKYLYSWICIHPFIQSYPFLRVFISHSFVHSFINLFLSPIHFVIQLPSIHSSNLSSNLIHFFHFCISHSFVHLFIHNSILSIYFCHSSILSSSHYLFINYCFAAREIGPSIRSSKLSPRDFSVHTSTRASYLYCRLSGLSGDSWAGPVRTKPLFIKQLFVND